MSYCLYKEILKCVHSISERMAKDLKQKILDTVQSGLNSTVHSLQAAVQTQPQGSAFYPTTLDQLASLSYNDVLSFVSSVCCLLHNANSGLLLYFILLQSPDNFGSWFLVCMSVWSVYVH